MYGYDIRNEESAPKARRRRKYGYVTLLHKLQLKKYC